MLAFWHMLFGLWSLIVTASGGSGAGIERTRALASVRQLDKTSLATSCRSCHPGEVAEWQGSRHALAFSNGLFRAEFDGRRTAWCASCHAPAAADPGSVRDDDPVAMEGVGCMSCHLDEAGHFVSKTRATGSPHPTLAKRDFGTDGFCGSCHQFNYPHMGSDGMPVGFQSLAMQDTLRQFRATSFAAGGGQCTDCHMAGADGHRFPGSHDEDMLRSALDVDACVQGAQLRVAIANVGAAHAVPTGGVNRHIVLRAWRSTDPASMQEFFIGRRFAGSEEGKELIEDTSLPAGSLHHFAFELGRVGGGPDEAINLELRYIYPLDEFAELAPGTRRYAMIANRRELVSEMPSCQP